MMLITQPRVEYKNRSRVVKGNMKTDYIKNQLVDIDWKIHRLSVALEQFPNDIGFQQRLDEYEARRKALLEKLAETTDDSDGGHYDA